MSDRASERRPKDDPEGHVWIIFSTAVFPLPGLHGLLPVLRCNILGSSERFRMNQEEAEMDGTTVAVDLTKRVFVVAVANERGQILNRKRYGRASFQRFLETRPPLA